jgi:hypothetical protein
LNPKPPVDWQEKLISLEARRSRRALLQAADDRGWAVRPGDLRWIPRTPLYVYLLEPIREQTVIGVVNWEDVAEIEEATPTLAWEEIPTLLTEMLAEDDPVKGRSIEDRDSRNEMLIALTVRYVAGTQTFRRVPGGTADAHFIILVYRPKGLGDPEGILRPLAMVARDRQGVLQPKELNEISRRVIEQDRATHPEWFPLATVHHFAPDTK